VTTALALAAGVLAQEPRETGPDFGKASPFGLLIVVLLLIGTVLLVWSMNRHLRKLPPTFDDGETEADPVADGDSAASDGDAQAPRTPREPDG
jgi:hypothetical protein